MADSKFEDRLRQPDAQQGNEDEKASAPQEGPSVDEGARERQSDEVKGRAPGPRARGGHVCRCVLGNHERGSSGARLSQD